MGKLIKGGEPDLNNVAIQVINDFQRVSILSFFLSSWWQGKLPYFIAPPRANGDPADAPSTQLKDNNEEDEDEDDETPLIASSKEQEDEGDDSEDQVEELEDSEAEEESNEEEENAAGPEVEEEEREVEVEEVRSQPTPRDEGGGRMFHGIS